MYYRRCPKCGETNMHQVTYDSMLDRLIVTCPCCKFTKMEETHERSSREKANGRPSS
jgi:transcription elongation factor Elf1